MPGLRSRREASSNRGLWHQRHSMLSMREWRLDFTHSSPFKGALPQKYPQIFICRNKWPANLLVNDRRNLASTRGLAVILLSLVYGATTFHRTNVRHLPGSRRETLVAGGCG